MGKVFIPGKMEESMMETMLWIKSMVMGYTSGQMEENMKVNGRMENNMEKANTLQLMEKLEEESGEMAKELNG